MLVFCHKFSIAVFDDTKTCIKTIHTFTADRENTERLITIRKIIPTNIIVEMTVIESMQFWYHMTQFLMRKQPTVVNHIFRFNVLFKTTKIVKLVLKNE